MKVEKLLIPALYADLFAEIAAKNGGIAQIDSLESLEVPKDVLFALFQRMVGLTEGSFKQDAPSSASKKQPMTENEPSKVNKSAENESNSTDRVEMNSPRSKNEQNSLFNPSHSIKNDYKSLFITKSTNNQENKISIPNVILEDWQLGDKNLIKAIFDYKNQPLKVVASRYGGNSAAANIANYLAKSDADLQSLRRSTAVRLAKAMQVPEEWILAVRKN